MSGYNIVAGIGLILALLMGSGGPEGAGPFWGLGFELRSIPSENMLPAYRVGDRVLVNTSAYRNGGTPQRGEVVIFAHPNRDKRVMIKRVVGLPGDAVQMLDGRLYLNGKSIERTSAREVTYLSGDRNGTQAPQTATQYSEQLPGEAPPHLIHEWSDAAPLDRTPVFKVPAGHLFMMGDNRDNSEDSRACSGHAGLAKVAREAWNSCFTGGEPAMGFVSLANLLGRAEGVAFSLAACSVSEAQSAAGVICP